jgi:hypothetical protein
MNDLIKLACKHDSYSMTNTNIRDDVYSNYLTTNNNNNNHNNINTNLIVQANDGSQMSSLNSYSLTPLTNRRSLFSSKLEKAMQTIKNNYGLSTTSAPTTSNANANANAALFTSVHHHSPHQNHLLLTESKLTCFF